MGGWDRGVEFRDVLKRLVEFKESIRRRFREKGELGRGKRRALRNVNILILALANGLKLSEAMECYSKFVNTGEREVIVKVMKSKDKYRLCIVPPLIDTIDIKLTKDLPIPRKQTIASFAEYHFNINTHSLRSAFIKHLLEKGLDITILSHRKLETLLAYIQERKAQEELAQIAKSIK